MTEQLEKAIQHIKTRADAWAVKEVTEALQSISERLDKALSQINDIDAISREDVLAEITRFSTEEGASVECQQLYCDVNNMPTVTQKSGKWIPVNERLPEDAQEVLYSTKTGCVFHGEYYDDNTDRKWFSYKDDIFSFNNVVNAWMPLPKPYEPQESEKVNCKSTKCENCTNHNYCDYEPQESEEKRSV